MLNWNAIISGLALAFAGFAYALVFFVLLPFRQYDYAAPLGGIAMAIAPTIAMNWLLSASLLTGWTWVAALFGFQVALMFFGSVFLEDGLYLPNLLFFGTMSVGYVSVYTSFLQKKNTGNCGFLYSIFPSFNVLLFDWRLCDPRQKSVSGFFYPDAAAVESKGRNYH